MLLETFYIFTKQHKNLDMLFGEYDLPKQLKHFSAEDSDDSIRINLPILSFDRVDKKRVLDDYYAIFGNTQPDLSNSWLPFLDDFVIVVRSRVLQVGSDKFEQLEVGELIYNPKKPRSLFYKLRVTGFEDHEISVQSLQNGHGMEISLLKFPEGTTAENAEQAPRSIIFREQINAHVTFPTWGVRKMVDKGQLTVECSIFPEPPQPEQNEENEE